MSDIQLDTYLHYGTAAQRAAFIPDPPIVSGVVVPVLYEWRETDTGNVYVYDTAWHQVGAGITQLTGDVTTPTGGGVQPATLATSGVTAATYGDATHVPQIAVDAKGRITSASAVAITGAPRVGAVGILIDGGGSAITTGIKAFLSLPFACTITGWTLLSTDAAATVGSIVVDIWKTPFASYPPTVANTITASALPTLSSAKAASSTTLTGWTTAVSAGDTFGFNVNSAATVVRVRLTLTITVP